MRFRNLQKFLLLTFVLVQAFAKAETTVLDLPVPTETPVPSGLMALPLVVTNGLPALRIPFLAQASPQSLAVTFYFKETEGVSLRVVWEGVQTSTLCENLSEGTGLATQRTVLIPAWRFQQAGTLSVQSSGLDLGVSRVRLTWLKVAPVLTASKSAVPALIQANGLTLSEREILTTAYPELEDGADGLVLRAPLLSEPMVLSNGVIFPVTLKAVPTLTKLDFLVSGLPLGARLVARLKDQTLGDAAVDLPDLQDAGYFQEKGQWTYQGWRKATLFVPSSELVEGDNELYVAAVDASGQEIAAPWALKEAVLQLRYASYAASKESQSANVQ